MTKSIMITSLLTLSLLSATQTSFKQKTFGGDKDDIAYAITATDDGGAIMIGSTRSFGKGRNDMSLIKLDAKGHKVWNKFFGGERKDYGTAVTQTTDGGYVGVGTTKSFGKGGYDYFIVKVDSKGNTLWQRTAGGDGKDQATAVTATKDGGVLVVGSSKSFGKGSYDFYALKLTKEGKVQWRQTAGGKDWDIPKGVVETDNGDFILVGKSESFGDNGYDGFVVKLDHNGKQLWEETYGGKKDDELNAIAKGKNGEFVLVGKTKSFVHHKGDAYILKINEDGDKLLEKTYGGTGKEYATAVTAAKNGDYLIVGSTRSVSNGRADILSIMIDQNGTVKGSGHYGGKKMDIAHGVTQIKDGSFFIAGETESYGNGGIDIFLIHQK